MVQSTGTPTHWRPSWHEVWLHAAEGVSARSLCVRAKVGAVIVDAQHRIVATGYNNPPSGFDHADLPCTEWCERSHKSVPECGAVGRVHPPHDGCHGNPRLTEPRQDYADCPALHAEANALLAADRSTWQRGTMYVIGDSCVNCAKLIANSGLAELVVYRPDGAVTHRKPEAVYEFLDRCGVTVIVANPTDREREGDR